MTTVNPEQEALAALESAYASALAQLGDPCAAGFAASEALAPFVDTIPEAAGEQLVASFFAAHPEVMGACKGGGAAPVTAPSPVRATTLGLPASKPTVPIASYVAVRNAVQAPAAPPPPPAPADPSRAKLVLLGLGMATVIGVTAICIWRTK